MLEDGKHKIDRWLKVFLIWRVKHLKHKQFIYILSVVIGLLSGLAAVILKNLAHWVELLLISTDLEDVSDLTLFFTPLIGIFLAVFVTKTLIKANIGHGIPNVLYAISKGNANMSKKGMYASALTSVLTVGFGGSVGLEGPSVGTTASIGSNLGQLLKLNYKTKVLLMACASSGAIASLFKAPIAAIVFSLEVIMIDLSAVSLIPLLLSTIAANLTSRLFLGEEVLFHFELMEDFDASKTIFYVLLGMVSGLVSVYFTRSYFFIGSWMDRLKNGYVKALVGGSIVGALIYIFPPLYGEGYSTVNLLIQGEENLMLNNIHFIPNLDEFWIVMLVLFAIIVFKTLATVLTLKSGGVGGIFAPALFLGAGTGYTFSKLVNAVTGTYLSSSNFTLVAMGGLMAGVLQAPLTGIFLIAELTGGYDLFLPLMITSSIAFITVKYSTPYSIYTRQLAKRGELLTHHKDRAVLTLMNLKNEVETNFIRMKPYQSLGDLVKAIAKSDRNLFPVVDDENLFLGVVTLNDARKVMFEQEKHGKIKVHELMTSAPEFIYRTDNMEEVMRKFDHCGAWNLPVIDSHGKYIGFVSKSKLFSAYRKRLKDFYEE